MLSLAGYVWVFWTAPGSGGHHPTACLFKTVTEIPCPSCGTTRSIAALAVGDVQESLLINPFGLLTAFALVIVPLWILADILRKRDSFYNRYVVAERYVTQHRWVVLLAGLIIVANWIWNISKAM
ncbi:MAG: DUF2752 domain-containing protein [Ignavibacteriales bacterium]|nr:DUF2752 domain-containing protein [Ignavibacteriales bacterium]